MVPGSSVAFYHLYSISPGASVVPVPAIPPNCLSSICGITASSTHFSTIDSNTFASIGVSAIGLMPFSIYSGGRFLGNGITVAVFHNFGSTPSRRELLNIDVTGPASCCAKSFTIHFALEDHVWERHVVVLSPSGGL